MRAPSAEPVALSTVVFLLSPAHCGGRRARSLLRPTSVGPLAGRLAAGTLTLGEAFAFMSGLYFRGKLAYAKAFARGPAGRSAIYVITPTRGLQSPDLVISTAVIEEFASLDVAGGGERFRGPLTRDTRALAQSLEANARVVLLGSIASDKYVGVLAEAFGDRLACPEAFVGRGDMSRGALMLRSATEAEELAYMPLSTATVRRGRRAPSAVTLADGPT